MFARKNSSSKALPLSSKMQQALASLRLEGVSLSSEVMVDIQLFDAGKITKEELLKRAVLRAKKI
jgi:hypothetical protein